MTYKHLKLTDLPDQAPSFGVDSLEARLARSGLGAEHRTDRLQRQARPAAGLRPQP